MINRRSICQVKDALSRASTATTAISFHELGATPATVGPWLTLNAKHCRFVADFADGANELSRHKCRKPFVAPSSRRDEWRTLCAIDRADLVPRERPSEVLKFTVTLLGHRSTDDA